MSDRLLHAVLCGAGVVVLLAGPWERGRLEAQDAAPYRARVDTLATLLEQAREAAGRAESARVAGVRIDSVVTGGLVLLTAPERRPRVEAAGQRAWSQLTALLGRDTDALGDLTLYLVQAGSREPRPLGAEDVPTVVYSEKSTEIDIAARIVWRLEEEAAVGLDTVTFEWLGRRIPLRPASPTELSRIYIELATRPARVVRECYLGNVDRCEEALLVRAVEDPATDWYEAAERRDLAAHIKIPTSARNLPEYRGYSTCLELGDDRACTEFLRFVYPYAFPPPFPTDGRRSLTALALQMGGEGAFSRFLDASDAEPAERLVRSAGIPLDSLVGAWRASVIAAKPPQTTIGRRLGWTAFFWVLVLTFVASRSTRWRRA